MGWDFGGPMGWMAVFWMFGVIVLLALIWTILQSVGRRSPRQEPPETILKRRYARGEIDREEYERRLTDLRK